MSASFFRPEVVDSSPDRRRKFDSRTQKCQFLEKIATNLCIYVKIASEVKVFAL